MKRRLSVILLLLIFGSMVFCQQAEFFDTVFESDELNWSQAVSLVLASSDLLKTDFSEQAAWECFTQQDWYQDTPLQDDTITVSKFTFLLAKAFNVKGGIFYTLFPSGRYSFRQLKADGVVPNNSDPTEKLSGINAMFIIQNAIDTYSVTSEGD